jgi:chromosome segregation ATPase
MRGSLDKRLEQAHAEVQKLRRKLQAAKNEPEPQDTNEEDAIKLATLQEKVEAAKEALEDASVKLEDVKAHRATLLPALELTRNDLKALQQTLAENSSEAAEEDVKEQTRKLETVMNALASAREKVEQMKRDRRAREESLTADMEKWNADLLDVKARTGVDKPSVPDISLVAAQATCNAAEKALAKESARLQRSPEAVAEIKARFEAADLVYRQEAALVHQVVEDLERLKAELLAHSKKFTISRNEMCQDVSTDFVDFMANKGYGAKLVFKHDPETKDQGELEILVTPDKRTRFGGASQMGYTQADAENAPLQHVGTLSGGEKSASTLILLAAIAFNSPVPFRMIDEFDVFQDEVSRKFSLKLLIGQGEQANLTGRYAQFILLTPHDISSVQPTPAQKDLIKVLKLKDPLRT